MSRVGGRLGSTVLVAALLAVAVLPHDVLAAATFGIPSAAATWGEGITFRQPVALEKTPRRVEIVVESSADTGAFVAEVPAAASGSTTFAYTLDVATGGYMPNTPFTAFWRVTYPDGTSEVGPPASATYADTRFDWRTSTGSIVRVHWYDGDAAFGARALRIGEAAVAKAAALLGVTEREPVDFFVYADAGSFHDALGPGTGENVGGQANNEIRTMFALITPDEIDDAWVGKVIPHELTHLVFDTTVANPYHYPPRWLNEGLAVYLSQGYDASDRSTVERAARDGELMPLDALTAQFPTTAQQFGLAYAESVSAVDYLVRTYATDGLVRLVRSYAQGRSDDEAFATALGVDAAQFGQAWLAELDAPEPVRYGPQPAPPGPLPSDWQGPAAAGGSTGSGPDASETPGGADRPAETPGALSASAPMRTRDLAAGLAILAVVLGIAGLGLYVTGRRRRSALPPVARISESKDVTEPTVPGAAPPDHGAPADGPSSDGPSSDVRS